MVVKLLSRILAGREQPAVPAWKERPDSMSPTVWRAARILSRIGNPMVLAVPCFFAVSYKATPRWPDRIRWWILSCSLITLVPLIHIRWGVRTGRISDHDVSVREERFWPYMLQIVTVGTTYALLRALGAPRLIVALVVSVSTAMVAITGVTLYWKMSMHVASTAGTVTVLSLVCGKRAVPLIVLVPAVAWSRYMLDHHTPAQALAGAALGAAAPLIVFRQMGLQSN